MEKYHTEVDQWYHLIVGQGVLKTFSLRSGRKLPKVFFPAIMVFECSSW